MKTINSFFTLFSASVILTLTMVSCGGSKKVTQDDVTKKSPENTQPKVGKEEVIEIPCSGVRTDDKFYRASGNGRSANLSMSRDKALLDAQQRLARSVNTQLKSVIEAFANERETENQSEFEAKTDQLTRSVTNEALKSITVTCETPTKSKNANGRVIYNTYIAIEMPVKTVLDKANNQISNSKKLEIDYDQQKFRDVFNQELNQIAEEKSDYVNP